jgi:MYXO-CTERM domain-containing protein
VLGEGRYEPQNFPSFVIDTGELSWDWAQSKSNYTELRAQKTAAGGGRAWEIESSINLYPQSIEAQVKNGTWNGQGPYPATDEERAAQDYIAVTDGQGTVLKTAAQVRDEDLATLFHGIPASTARVTRLRADLAHASLDQDLAMSASTNQTLLSNVRQITKETNQPQCPVYEGCEQTGTAPRDEANARSKDNWGSGNGGTFSCTTSQTGGLSWMTAGFGLAGLAIARAVRRRRR